ncbi:MAG: pepsin/retropepsin-like aspartic protease family protein [Pseudomonadota bacterium]
MCKQLFAALAALLLSDATALAQSCTLPALADTAELKQVPGSDLITVAVAINGKPKQFLLNLSTNPSEVSQAAVTELGLPQNVSRADTIHIGGWGPDLSNSMSTSMQAPVYDVKGSQGRNAIRTRVRVGAFTIGNATNRNMQFLVAEDPEMGKSLPYDGLLSNDFFNQYDVELNFAGKEINYLTATKCTDPAQVVFWSHSAVAAVPMTIVNGKFQVPVTIEGHTINAIIDTTSARTVMRRDVAELMFGLKADTPEMKPELDRKDALGGPVYAHRFGQIDFEGVTASNKLVLIQTNGMTRDSNRDLMLGSRAQVTDERIPDLTLGMDLLRQLHIYAVFGQKTLYMTATQQAQ